jgi:hypothetical protein
MSTHYLFRVTSLLEVAAGLALFVVPAVAMKVVFGVDQAHPEALAIGRLGGAALLAIGVACWGAQRDGASPSQRGLLRGALVYNIGAVAVLAYAGSMLDLAGLMLWPTAVLHMGLAAWCLVAMNARPTAR